MLKNYPSYNRALRFDLYRKIPNEALNQAEHSFKNHLVPDFGFNLGGADDEVNKMRSEFSTEFGREDFF